VEDGAFPFPRSIQIFEAILFDQLQGAGGERAAGGLRGMDDVCLSLPQVWSADAESKRRAPLP